MEILRPEQYGEYEEFVRSHRNGSLMQSVLWHGVKQNWKHDIAVVRAAGGSICAGISVLARKMPGFGTTMLYAPRGPVCDYDDSPLLKELQQGIDQVAKKHNAHIFKMDPDLRVGETNFLEAAQALGYRRFYEPTGFATIQTRFNYRLYFEGRGEEQILADMHSKTRYNIRLAERKGVTVRVGTKADLDDFMHLMDVTGTRDGFSVRSKDYFETMLDTLGEHIRLYLADYEGKPIAGAITSNYAGKTCYIYGASDNEHRNVMAPYLIQWEMIRWALETGCTVYDFMGVSGNMDENDPLYGLFRFKDGFKGVVDELVGELDYVYKPLVNSLVNRAIACNEWLREKRRKKL